MSGTYTPHVEDSDAMTDIHSRMTSLIERMIPMNMHDSNWLCDGVIQFQDEAYVCGRKRGVLECNAELLEVLIWREQFEPREGEGSNERFERIAETFHRETGFLRPGKDCRLHPTEVRKFAWDEWMEQGRARVRAAIAKALGSADHV